MWTDTTSGKIKTSISQPAHAASPTKRSHIPGLLSRTPLLSRRGGLDRPSASPIKVAFNGLSGPGDATIDPEDAVIDIHALDEDISMEIDRKDLEELQDKNHGAKDKVLVSIRIKPTNDASCWSINAAKSTMQLQEQFARTGVNATPEFCFDEIMTGSDNKLVYNTTAKSHVQATMDGFNSVVFAYGQTASGKTFTLSGSDEDPGIIPRAMKDVFSYIRRTPSREFLLRASYVEIYNEQIHDLLSPASLAQPVGLQGAGQNVIITPLREEVVTSLKAVREVLERGERNRRTATTDWNERSSRSHSVFRLLIESRDRTSPVESAVPSSMATPNTPVTPGGPLLQAKNGRSVRTSVLNLIDLAGSERATSDKDRTREGKFINTSLLTLGTVIGTLADNAAKGKADHVPYRNSKLTRMLQPHISGNARISVICTMNPSQSAVTESTSTLLFAQRVKKVQLNAQKQEVVDTSALIERYRSQIEDLQRRLAEREQDGPVKNRRLSAREQVDESRAMQDLQTRINQLTKFILTSQNVEGDRPDGDEDGPMKLNFDLSAYELQQELLSARREVETQANQILSLEAALSARSPLSTDAPDDDKDKLILDQAKTIRELETVVQGYEDNLGEPLRQVREDVEREWITKVAEERRMREEKDAWAQELICQIEKEKQMRQKLADEKLALQLFVADIEQIQFNMRSRLLPPATGGTTTFADLRKHTTPVLSGLTDSTNASFSRVLADAKFKQAIKLDEIEETAEPTGLRDIDEENLITK
ncbi:kinesin-domain-containing protein [Auriculariales sp. MPI-PUGE-AT-0066]|nr:kinesin-domain-containing protein [Auriculariales sp. MPI-PUGE-AT-0066]